MRFTRLARGAFLAAIFMGLAAQTAARAEYHPPLPPGTHGVDWPMSDDPRLPRIPRKPVFHHKLKGLWQLAMSRPEPGMRLQALLALGAAARLGMTDAGDMTPRARELFNDEKQDIAIRMAAAGALATLDVKDAGPDLLRANQTGDLEMALATDPPLARWKTAGAEELWIARIKEAGSSEQLLSSAMRSVSTPAAVEPVRAVLMDPARSIATRTVAAESLASLAPANATEIAQSLVSRGSMEDRLLAALSLPAKADAKGVQLLVTLVQDAESAVASAAVQKLIAGSPESLAPLVAKLSSHPDAIVRRHAVSVLKRHADAPNIATLGELLNDRAPRVRTDAREALIALDANESHRPRVREAALKSLNKTGPQDWRGNEQAALVVGSVHEVSSRDRCLALLRHPQQPVRVGAVVALRRLKLSDTVAPQFERAQELAADFKNRTSGKSGTKTTQQEYALFDDELAHLNQNLGLARHTAANAYLQGFIPKGAGWAEDARTSAIWALGLLHENKSDPATARMLLQRMGDEDQLNPEFMDVRVMATLSLARMKDQAAPAAFRRMIETPSDGTLVEAAKWGVAYLEGKPYITPDAIPQVIIDWFLEPAD
jgi:HEAT repeat protein